jgi:N-acetylglucosaminyl-diphospho-decaprenol L-rhamnosyltransferase
VRVAVVTLVAGRANHLACQAQALRLSDRFPDRYIIVDMSGRGEASTLAATVGATLISIQPPGRRLPLASARNAGARTAVDEGADLLIFLDVDCLPSKRLVERYCAAAEEPGGQASLLCGPVGELPPPPHGNYDLEQLAALSRPFDGRPIPNDTETVTTSDYHLFWSMSFAISVRSWDRLGGFYPGYRGYGGEDTDFGQQAKAAGIALRWVGGAWAHHQYHPKNDPPVEHLHDILSNGRVFYDRWGWWPMTRWLRQFQALGLVTYDALANNWSERVGPSTSAE